MTSDARKSADQIATERPSVPLHAALRSRRVELTPVEPRHYDDLYRLAVSEPHTWPWQGSSPSTDNFPKTLWSGVADQRRIANRIDGTTGGLVSLYSVHPLHRTGYVRAYVVAACRRAGWPLEGVLLFMQLAFIRYDLRKLYFDMTDRTTQLTGLRSHGLLVEEARLRDHVYVDGAYHDAVIKACYRETWLDTGQRILFALGAEAATEDM